MTPAVRASFWTASGAGGAVPADGVVHVAALTSPVLNGDQTLLTTVTNGVQVNEGVFASVDFWFQFTGTINPKSLTQIGVQIDRGGGNVTNVAHTELDPDVTYAHTTWQGQALAGAVVRAIYACDTKDTLTVTAGAYFTVYTVPFAASTTFGTGTAANRTSYSIIDPQVVNTATHGNEALRRLAGMSVNAMQGKLNIGGSVTLNGTTATLKDSRIGGQSLLLFMPLDQAGLDLLNGLYVSSRDKGQAVLNYPSASNVVVEYVVIG
jgi:hypothetical protein